MSYGGWRSVSANYESRAKRLARRELLREAIINNDPNEFEKVLSEVSKMS